MLTRHRGAPWWFSTDRAMTKYMSAARSPRQNGRRISRRPPVGPPRPGDVNELTAPLQQRLRFDYFHGLPRRHRTRAGSLQDAAILDATIPTKPDPYLKTYRWAAGLCSSDGCSDRATGNGTQELHRDGRGSTHTETYCPARSFCLSSGTISTSRVAPSAPSVSGRSSSR
jgi:hypothetical protein